MTRTADPPHAANFYLADRRGGGAGTGNVAASPSTRAPGPQPVAGGHADRQPREGWGCGGAALRCQRPHLVPRGTLRAQPRLGSPSSALLLLIGSLSPWVSAPVEVAEAQVLTQGREDAGFPP